ncbi:hypothetical protein BaRGS_00031612 [Batillaria attramentaria]|uniref:Uncharacterized protein n=1 Tax=Batillaria attramentaria TaxID=370345 RepID=A0ABD0JPY5_9CAEN
MHAKLGRKQSVANELPLLVHLYLPSNMGTSFAHNTAPAFTSLSASSQQTKVTTTGKAPTTYSLSVMVSLQIRKAFVNVTGTHSVSFFRWPKARFLLKRWDKDN